MADRDLSQYVEVAERIADFRAKYPEGSLQGEFNMIQVGDQQLLAFRAFAYRSPDDHRPGHGHAWELVPGRTPYTRGSELQNAETSAWGRAIIAVGASDSKRGIASREEVRNRQAERDDGLPTNADGSLSRSRTSDAEKAAAGVMTDAEQRAHNALAKPPPNTSRAERIRPGNDVGGLAWQPNPVDAVVDDRWTSDAPSWAVGVDPPEDQPGSILPAQSKQMHAVYSALGIKLREDRLADAERVLELGAGTLQSSADLSHQQAARLLENLHERHTGKTTRR